MVEGWQGGLQVKHLPPSPMAWVGFLEVTQQKERINSHKLFTYPHAYIAHVYMYIHIYRHAHAFTHTHTQCSHNTLTYTYMHTKNAHTHFHTHTHSHTHTFTYTHPHTHTYSHTHTHTNNTGATEGSWLILKNYLMCFWLEFWWVWNLHLVLTRRLRSHELSLESDYEGWGGR